MAKCNNKQLLQLVYFALCLGFALMILNVVLPHLYYESVREDEFQSQIVFHRDARETNDRVIESLQHQIKDLNELIKKKSELLDSIKKLNTKREVALVADQEVVRNALDEFKDGDRIYHYVKEQTGKAELVKGNVQWDEYAVNYFAMFDRRFIYLLDTGLKMRPKDIISGKVQLPKELHEVVSEGIRRLNEGHDRHKVSPTYRFTDRDFLHGLFRTERILGTQYELVYKPISSSNIAGDSPLFKVTFFRPYAPLHYVQTFSSKMTEKVHFIVPLQRRIETFRLFIEYFKDFAITDGNVHLTVVYYGEDELAEVNKTLSSLEATFAFHDYKLISVLGEDFSRGKALQKGVDSLNAVDPLLFFCDVDIAFKRDFLNQCRSHTIAGTSVFYPIVFSLYNPALTYKNRPMPSLRDRLVIANNNGLWRDFGFGMSCQYLSDFVETGGFDLTIKGWGTEDGLLYRKYLKSPLIVIRTPVNSLFHHWHGKHCDRTWSSDQYNSCLRSRARTEGSQLTLGLEYYELKGRLESTNAS